MNSEKIRFKEKFCYGLGDVACGLVYVLSATYITFFYTDALGLNAAIVGSIIMFSRFADGISDVVAGYIVDRTKSDKGKARVWLLRNAIPIGVGTVLTFTVPSGNGIGTYIYVAITYNLVNTILYTMTNLPFGTLNSLMTRDQNERMVINVFRMLMAQVGSMVTNACTIPLINLLGGTQHKKSWIVVAVIYGIIAAVLLLICYCNTKERVHIIANNNKEHISVIESFRVALKNQYWLIIVAANVLLFFAVSVGGTVGAYYAKYILNNENAVGIINAVMYAPAIIVIPLLPFVANKLGKRNIMLIGNTISIVGQALMLLSPASYVWLVMCSFIKGIGSSMMMGTIFAMIADTIEFGDWKTGKRIEGVLYASSSFGTKVGGGVGGAVALGVLGAAGYDGVAATQPDTVITAISNMYLILPLVVFIIGTLLFCFYKLDKIYPQIIEELQKREREKVR